MPPLFTLTATQQAAINRHDCNIAVSAGAGSGKTFILTNRFLSLLEARPDWRLNQIVAITFTQKAAGEMRDRVRGLLLAKAAETGDIQWQARLNEMDSARIGTIHSLCASLLRANAAIIGIDPDFSVLDEAQSLLMRQNAVEDSLYDLAAMPELAMMLFDEYDPQQVIKALSENLNSDMRALPLNLFEHWNQAYLHALRQTLMQLQHTAVFIEARDFSFEGIQESDKLTVIWQEYAGHMRALSSDDLETCLYALQTLSRAKVGNIGSGAVWGDVKEYRAVLIGAVAACREAFAALGSPPGDDDARAALLLEGWRQAVILAGDHYQRLKDAARALDFDDLELKTRALLAASEIAARYDGAEFQHLLVDEFQDTSAAQWEIVRALASPERAGALFIVGDPQQSIYRFRGADPTTFEQAEAAINASGGLSLSLDESFRSHQPLVGCFNAAFSNILTRDDSSPVARYQSIYGASMRAYRVEPPCDENAIELYLHDKERMGEGDSEARRVWEAQTIARKIQTLVAHGRPCYDKAQGDLRPLNYGDFAILFRGMRNVTLYENGLREAGIPYVTLGGRSYYDRPEVWDVLHLLIALHNPNDELALASALRSPLFGFSDEMLLALRLPENADMARQPLWYTLMTRNHHIPEDNLEIVTFARKTLRKLTDFSGRISVAELMQMALDETGYLAILTALPDGARRRMNVEKLVTLAMQPGAATQSISAFTRTVQSLTDLEVRESEAVVSVEGAVQIMSVHASKGLEFPVVIIADAASMGRRNNADLLINDPDLEWVCKLQRADDQDKVPQSFTYRRAVTLESQREEAESRRLLYVAATRAQDLLIISGENKADKTDWISLLRSGLRIEAAPSEENAFEEYRFQGDWGEGRLCFPDYLDTPEQMVQPRAGAPFSGANTTISPEMPPLLAPLPAQQPRIRGVRATALAGLGEFISAKPSQQIYMRTRWRAENLQSGAHTISRAVTAPGRISGVIIGELIHRALRWDTNLQPHPELFERLCNDAWELGLVREQDRIAAAQRAQTALHSVRNSAVYQQVLSAKQCFRELPFVLQLGQNTIHGTIDVVFQRDDGTWALIDYKTASTPAQLPPDEQAEHDILQISVYAHAAATLLELDILDVYIHYIRSNQTIEIDRARWRQTFEHIEQAISEIISEND
ncbi:MAG: UvrD-helicase domain-containing protein [Anaerolineae bacterium]|nr:UvrD-helicase domain-containing protein [Anaerolineae bacterium]